MHSHITASSCPKQSARTVTLKTQGERKSYVVERVSHHVGPIVFRCCGNAQEFQTVRSTKTEGGASSYAAKAGDGSGM